MIQSVLTLRALPGREQEVERFYQEHAILSRAAAFPGCLGTRLLRSVDGEGATHLVTADWDDASTYAGWVADPWRAAMALQLAQLLDSTGDEAIIAGLFEPLD